MANEGRQLPHHGRGVRISRLALATALLGVAALALAALASGADAAAGRGGPGVAAAPPAAAPSAPGPAGAAYEVPPSRRMTLSFPRRTARIAGPGALVQVRCAGSSAARCIGTLALRAAGAVHKAPFSIGKGRRQYVVVPLGTDRGLLDRLEAARATATASTVQLGGAAVTTRRALELK